MGDRPGIAIAPSPGTGSDDGVSLGPLTDLAGFMLRQAQLRMFETFFADVGGDGIRPGEISILVAIGENPGIRQGVLADALRIKRSNMAKIVRQMGDEGLVERRVPDADRRAIELHLTGAGHDLVRAALPKVRRSDTAALKGLSETERRTLLALLARLVGPEGAAP